MCPDDLSLEFESMNDTALQALTIDRPLAMATLP
jgi:hypothetical protein